MTVKQAKHLLKSIGVSINKNRHGEYRVNFLGAGESTAYYTDDLADAVATAKAMVLRRDGGGMRNPHLKKYSGREGSAEFRHMTLEEAKMLRSGETMWMLARDGSAVRVRLNGKVRRWKREPDRIEVPVKYGMYEYSTLYTRDFGSNGVALVEI